MKFRNRQVSSLNARTFARLRFSDASRRPCETDARTLGIHRLANTRLKIDERFPPRGKAEAHKRDDLPPAGRSLFHTQPRSPNRDRWIATLLSPSALAKYAGALARIQNSANLKVRTRGSLGTETRRKPPSGKRPNSDSAAQSRLSRDQLIEFRSERASNAKCTLAGRIQPARHVLRSSWSSRACQVHGTGLLSFSLAPSRSLHARRPRISSGARGCIVGCTDAL